MRTLYNRLSTISCSPRGYDFSLFTIYYSFERVWKKGITINYLILLLSKNGNKFCGII